MAWRFAREALLARRKFLGGDPVPGWLSEPGMLRFIQNKWPGLLRQDDAGAAPPAPTPPPPAEQVKQEQLEASWREWQEMRERLEPFRGGEDEEDSDEIR